MKTLEKEIKILQHKIKILLLKSHLWSRWIAFWSLKTQPMSHNSPKIKP